MTATAIESPLVRPPHRARSASRLFEPFEVTLEDAILGAWEALGDRGLAECPVCAGTLERTGCARCGSELS